MTLRTRLTAMVGAIVALAIAGGAYAAYRTASRELRAETDRFLATRAARLVRTAEGAQARSLPLPLLALGGGLPETLVALDSVTQVLRGDGSVVARVTGQPALPVDAGDVALARDGGPRRLRNATVGGARYRLLTAPVAGGGAVQVARSQLENDAVLASLRARLLGLAAAGTAIAAAVAWAVAKRATKPIERLTEASERVAATQELAAPIEVAGHDEVARLAASFNTMLAALRTSREQQRRLVVDASHELRTPLTAIRTNVEFLRRAGDSLAGGERRALLEETSRELDDLSHLVVELVELATAARAEEPAAPVDLAEVVDEVAARFRRRSGRTISVDAPAAGAVVVEGRRGMLDRAVSNLVDNALKFSVAPAAVDILVAAGRVEVADRGPGIAPEDRARVFDRFYRAGATRSLPGSGLGLAIVKEIVDLHGGQVAAEPRPGGGTTARITLPAPAPARGSGHQPPVLEPEGDVGASGDGHVVGDDEDRRLL